MAQRGAASFVAQLRDTKENSDVLVSLILTKDNLLIAGKPRLVPSPKNQNCRISAAAFVSRLAADKAIITAYV